ncbi:MAG: outer membrane protein transport protein [Deltaproteobacteria bacterium]|nr:outer membrane protein transport protein [Deltaproteobacteria bacterium]
MLLILAALATPARAASLDLLEVGGMWGTPGATDATALWWNPAGLAVDDTTTFVAEGAPVLARIGWERPNPDYGTIDRDNPPDGPDTETYDYSGTQNLEFTGVVPYLGVHSTFGIPNLGVGIGLAVPYARGGQSDDPDGIGRQNIREGNITTIYAMLGAAYDIADVVSIGVTGAFYDNTWDVDVDTEAVTSLRDTTAAQGFEPTYWQDSDTESADYMTNLDFDKLKDSGVTFNVGANLHPQKQWSLAVSYNHGATLLNRGDVELTFTCPPESDFLGRGGASSFGLCDPDTGEGRTIQGTATIGYKLPSRINAGFVLTPIKRVRLELMGAYVMWSAFQDYDIDTTVTADAIEHALDDEKAQEAADLVSQSRQWARDNRNTFWIGADGKFKVHKHVLLGARVLYDRSAVPTTVLSTNNFDANTIALGALVAFKPIKPIDIGLSYGRHIFVTRTVTDSALGLDIDPEERNADRYFWPNANGTYSGGINRFGISVRGRFGLPGGDED